MATENTEHDTAAAASPEDAAAVDTAAEPKPDLEAEAVAQALSEDLNDDGAERKPKAEGEAPKPTQGEPAPSGEETKPAEGATPAEAAKADPLDVEDDPKSYKGRTGERVEALRKSGLEWREKANKAEETNALMKQDVDNWNGYVALVQDSGGTAEDLGMAMATIRAVVKGTPEERKTAFQVVEALRTTLADQLGIALPDVDYLKDHADLKKQVEDGDLSEAAAREIAASRRFVTRTTADQTARAEADKNRRTEEQTRQDQVDAQQRVANETTALAQSYLNRDGQETFSLRAGYATRQINAMREAKLEISPERGKELFQKLYNSDDATNLVHAAKAGQQRNTKGARPIMGSQQGGSGGARAAPMSEEEAIKAALSGDD